jgi:hypothetical protein
MRIIKFITKKWLKYIMYFFFNLEICTKAIESSKPKLVKGGIGCHKTDRSLIKITVSN